jgi:hypothetical protein
MVALYVLPALFHVLLPSLHAAHHAQSSTAATHFLTTLLSWVHIIMLLLHLIFVLSAFPQHIVDSIMANNQPPIPADKVLGFRSRKAAEEYLAAHPDGALGALHFYRSGERAMSYIVQANTTVRSSIETCCGHKLSIHRQ